MVADTIAPTAPPVACAWCGRAFGEGSEGLPGRLRCRGCGVATTDPWPSDADLARAYAGWYRPQSGRFSGVGDRLLRRTRARLAVHLDQRAPPGPVLDVGAGDGALLDALRARGRDATGLERRSSRPDVRESTVQETDGVWSAVVFWHSLEHLREPGEALRAASRLLAPGGILVVAVPNAESLQAAVFGGRWFALDFPRHLVHIPASALRASLKELGLEVERESPLRGGQVVFGWLYGLVGLLPGHPDLYDAIRRPEARRTTLSGPRRAAALGAAAVIWPLAVAAGSIEALLGRGGTVYIEARA